MKRFRTSRCEGSLKTSKGRYSVAELRMAALSNIGVNHMADLVSMIWDSYKLNGLSAKSWSTVTLELHLVIDIPT